MANRAPGNPNIVQPSHPLSLTVIRDYRTFALDYLSGMKVLKMMSVGGSGSPMRATSIFPFESVKNPEDKIILSRFTRTIHYADGSSYCEMWVKSYDNEGNVTYDARSACKHDVDGKISRVRPSNFAVLNEEQNDEWRDSDWRVYS